MRLRICSAKYTLCVESIERSESASGEEWPGRVLEGSGMTLPAMAGERASEPSAKSRQASDVRFEQARRVLRSESETQAETRDRRCVE